MKFVLPVSLEIEYLAETDDQDVEVQLGPVIEALEKVAGTLYVSGQALKLTRVQYTGRGLIGLAESPSD